MLGGGGKRGVGQGALGNAGILTLEQMNLDRKDYTHDDEYDPLNPTQMKQKQNINLELQAQKHYLDKQNAVGGQMWTPELAA